MGEQQKPKSNVATIVIIIVVVLVVLSLGGFFASRYLAHRAVNTMLDTLVVSPTSYKTNNSLPTATWPTDFTVSVPKYTKGTITSVVKIEKPKTWDILIANTTKADFENYMAEVKAAGWVQQGETAFLVDMIQFRKDSWDLTMAFDASSNGVKITLTEAVK